MGLLDNNRMLVSPITGLENTNFEKIFSTDAYDAFVWKKSGTRTTLRLTFRDVYAWSDSSNIYLLKGKISDEPTTIAINSTNFPNLRGTPAVERIIACPCSFVIGSARYGSIGSISADDIRVCVIFTNGQVYHNYPSCYNDHDFYSRTYATRTGGDILLDSMFTKFDESVV
jgi:hypothetical protein